MKRVNERCTEVIRLILKEKNRLTLGECEAVGMLAEICSEAEVEELAQIPCDSEGICRDATLCTNGID